MVDLTVRFIPTLSEEFGETIDAQRVRGFDPLQRGGGPMTRLRRLAPVFVPVTVGSLAGAEDTIDAMDLRAFGTGKRTWYRQLQMDAESWLVVAVVRRVLPDRDRPERDGQLGALPPAVPRPVTHHAQRQSGFVESSWISRQPTAQIRG